MFEGINRFFKRGSKPEQLESASKDMAKERLHLVLMQDRANVSTEFLELMKQEIIDVMQKYVIIDEKEIDVRLTNQTNPDGTTGAPTLYANVPIINIRNEMKAEMKNELTENNTMKNNIDSEKLVEENYKIDIEAPATEESKKDVSQNSDNDKEISDKELQNFEEKSNIEIIEKEVNEENSNDEKNNDNKAKTVLEKDREEITQEIDKEIDKEIELDEIIKETNDNEEKKGIIQEALDTIAFNTNNGNERVDFGNVNLEFKDDKNIENNTQESEKKRANNSLRKKRRNKK